MSLFKNILKLPAILMRCTRALPPPLSPNENWVMIYSVLTLITDNAASGGRVGHIESSMVEANAHLHLRVYI